MTSSWIDPRVIEFDVHLFESVAEDNINRASRVDEDSPNFQISYEKIYDEWIAERLIDLAGFVFRESYRVVLTISGRRW